MSQGSTVLKHPARAEAINADPHQQRAERGSTAAVDDNGAPGRGQHAEAPPRRSRPRRHPRFPRRYVILPALLVALAALAFAYQDKVKGWSDQALHVADQRLLGAFRADMASEVGAMRSATETMVQASEARVVASLSPEITGARAELAALSGDLAEIKVQLAALTARLTGAEAAQSISRESITALTGAVAAQAGKLAAFETRFDRSVTRQTRIFRDLTLDPLWLDSVQREGASRSLPFTLLSLDVWGGRTQIAAKMGDDVAFLEVGDQVQGWTIEGTDAARQEVTVLDPSERAFVYSLHDASLLPVSAGGSSVGLPRLTVVANPPDATVMVMNIGPRYHPEMPLSPGAYDILVRKPGYQTFRRWIVLREGDRTLSVKLEPATSG